ncbi:hypothetical protein [uncultured Paraglaciecola sp.]|uniref:hypothetical protein n=1 Tax=uncultured Paraglaciecola sp. TaxID=1765024 RepID=UPI00263A0C0C|nr:hypothetical protein [uncultured Paraglaciecola sp.]
MAGLARICKMYGAMDINGNRFVWDYVANKAIPESDMPMGSERWKESEKVKWSDVRDRLKQNGVIV